MNLLRRYARGEAAAFPDGLVGYAVGDIHGRADLLERMLDKLESVAETERRHSGEPIVVFLGDYIDRGPESARVLDLLIDGRPRGYERRYLRGNHEQSMLAFLDDPVRNLGWVRHGGAETLLSYGIKPPGLVQPSAAHLAAAAEALRDKLPQAHRDFLDGLQRYVVLGDYVFVHAGVDFARPIEQQTDEDLYWARARFLKGRQRFSHRVVHGHTPASGPHADERRVGVDTGAYTTGVLTAARFEGADVSFITAEHRAASQ
ncbi:MAG: metallophosphoesterase family protein [Hyphomonadaceae bacterium]